MQGTQALFGGAQRRALKAHENGTSVGDPCRKMEISEDLSLDKAVSEGITRRKR